VEEDGAAAAVEVEVAVEDENRGGGCGKNWCEAGGSEC
jgi:hypothetical protein